MDKLKNNREVSWFEISEKLTILSLSLRNGNRKQIEKYLIDIFLSIGSLCQKFEISMDNCWNKWKRKAINKEYL